MKGGGGRRKYTKKYTQPISEQGSLYGGQGVTTDSCNSIKFETQLQKVTTEIFTVAVGDILSIILKKTELQAVNGAGKVCGSIISSANSRIAECIEKGYAFVAKVKSRSLRVCIVIVQIK